MTTDTGVAATREGGLRAALRQLSDFAVLESSLLSRQPGLILQQAANAPDDSVPARLASERFDSGAETRPWFRWIDKPRERSRRLLKLEGHTDRVHFSTMSSDGRTLLSLGADALRYWDAETGEELPLPDMRMDTGSLRHAMFVPGGLWAFHEGDSPTSSRASGAARSPTYSFEFFKEAVGHPKPRLHFPQRRVACLAVSPDGRRVSFGYSSGNVGVYDLVRGQHLIDLEAGDLALVGCSFSAQGERLGAVDPLGNVSIWDAHSFRLIRTFHSRVKEPRACTLSPDGSLVAIAAAAGLALFETDSGAFVESYREQVAPLTACTFSIDGTRLFSSARDGSIHAFRSPSPPAAEARSSGRPRGEPKLPAEFTQRSHQKGWQRKRGPRVSRLLACDLSYEGTVAAMAHANGVFVHRLRESSEARIDSAFKEAVETSYDGFALRCTACALSPDGRTVLVGSESGRLHLQVVGDGPVPPGRLVDHSYRVTSCAFSPDGQYVLSGSEDCLLKLQGVGSRSTTLTLRGHSMAVSCAEFSPDGRLIVSASKDETIRIWNSRDGSIVRVLSGHGRSVECCAFSPEGGLVVSGASDGNVRLWDVADGGGRALAAGHDDSVVGCAFMPGGGFLVSASRDGRIHVYGFEADVVVARFIVGSPIRAFSMSGDGGRILAATDGRVFLLTVDNLVPATGG